MTRRETNVQRLAAEKLSATTLFSKQCRVIQLCSLFFPAEVSFMKNVDMVREC